MDKGCLAFGRSAVPGFGLLNRVAYVRTSDTDTVDVARRLRFIVVAETKKNHKFKKKY